MSTLGRRRWAQAVQGRGQISRQLVAPLPFLRAWDRRHSRQSPPALLSGSQETSCFKCAVSVTASRLIGPRVHLPLLHPDRPFQDRIAHPPYSSSSPARSGIIQYSACLATRAFRSNSSCPAKCILSFDAFLVLLLPRSELRVPASRPAPGFHRPQLSYSHCPIP